MRGGDNNIGGGQIKFHLFYDECHNLSRPMREIQAQGFLTFVWEGINSRIVTSEEPLGVVDSAGYCYTRLDPVPGTGQAPVSFNTSNQHFVTCLTSKFKYHIIFTL